MSRSRIRLIAHARGQDICLFVVLLDEFQQHNFSQIPRQYFGTAERVALLYRFLETGIKDHF